MADFDEGRASADDPGAGEASVPGSIAETLSDPGLVMPHRFVLDSYAMDQKGGMIRRFKAVEASIPGVGTMRQASATRVAAVPLVGALPGGHPLGGYIVGAYRSLGAAGQHHYIASSKDRKVFDAIFPSLTTSGLLSMIVPPGFSARFYGVTVRRSDFAVRVFARICADGTKEDVGLVQREYRIDSDGRRHAIHDELELFPQFQKQGYGRRFLLNSVAHYKLLGIETISLLASKSVGRYAWAMFGFDSDAGTIARARGHVRGELVRRGYNPDLVASDLALRRTMWEIGAFELVFEGTRVRIPPSEPMKKAGIQGEHLRFGKYALLEAPPWHGRMSLDGDSDTFRQFLVYTWRQ